MKIGGVCGKISVFDDYQSEGSTMGDFYIFGAGEYYGKEPRLGEDDFVLAADGGLRYLREKGIEPDVILGDFDSLGAVPEGGNVIMLPTHKDDTDTGAGIKLGLQQGYTVFHIYGGVGGRLDHTLANISLAAFLADKGCRCYIHGDGVIITALKDTSVSFGSGKRGTFSAFAYTERCVVTLSGFEYELEDYELTSLYPLGVSNSFVGREAEVKVKSGILIAVYSE